MAGAISGMGKLANKPATTTINASANAKIRLRILKFEKILDNFDILTTWFIFAYNYNVKITTKSYQCKDVRTKNSFSSPNVSSISKDAYFPM